MISAWISKNRCDERALVEAEAVPLGLRGEDVDDSLLPVDQGAVAVGGHPLDVLQLW